MRRPIRKADREEVAKLTAVLSNHAFLATRRSGRLKTCMCDLCGHAMRKLERIRGKA